MKNKGFTLVEVLAVIVIIGILITMASLGVTRYRKDVDYKDLLNLHSSLETSFNNYRTVLAMDTGEKVTSITIDKNTESKFDRYIEDLSYNGKRLSKDVLDGTTITVTTKGEVLKNSTYLKKGESQFIKDATCMVTSSIDSGSNEINRKCKTNSTGEPEPSIDELVCLTIKYNGDIIVNDHSNDTAAFNKLCYYLNNE